MRARELRDVVEVLIIPSLDRALEELTGKSGSRVRAWLLVRQSVDQLRGIMREPASAPQLPLDAQRADTPEVSVNTGGESATGRR